MCEYWHFFWSQEIIIQLWSQFVPFMALLAKLMAFINIKFIEINCHEIQCIQMAYISLQTIDWFKAQNNEKYALNK